MTEQETNVAYHLDQESLNEIMAWGENVNTDNSFHVRVKITWVQLFKNIVSATWDLITAIPAAVYLKLKEDYGKQ